MKTQPARSRRVDNTSHRGGVRRGLHRSLAQRGNDVSRDSGRVFGVLTAYVWCRNVEANRLVGYGSARLRMERQSRHYKTKDALSWFTNFHRLLDTMLTRYRSLDSQKKVCFSNG